MNMQSVLWLLVQGTSITRMVQPSQCPSSADEIKAIDNRIYVQPSLIDPL